MSKKAEEKILETLNKNPINNLLLDILTAKYEIMLMYINHGDKLLAINRDSIHAHFKTHIEEERATIYELNRKLVARTGEVSFTPLSPNNAPANNFKEIVKCLLEKETQLIELWTKLGEMTKNDFVLNSFAQDQALIDQAHLEDMQRYARST